VFFVNGVYCSNTHNCPSDDVLFLMANTCNVHVVPFMNINSDLLFLTEHWEVLVKVVFS